MKSAVVVLSLIAMAAGWRLGCDGGGSRAGHAAADPTGTHPRRTTPPVPVTAVVASELCMTRGEVAPLAAGRLLVTDPVTRGVVSRPDGDVGELRFVDRGQSAESARLASGRVVRQAGLKLRAQDGCNLVYVMWRLAPTPGLDVKVKRNPGKRVHEECGVDGYRSIRPSFAREVPAVTPRSEHRLHAEVTGQEITVWADGAIVFEGDLGEQARDLAGPMGFRLDNEEAEIEMLGMPPAGGRVAQGAARCKSVAGD